MSAPRIPASLGDAYARRAAETRAAWDRRAAEAPAEAPEPAPLPSRPTRGHLASVPDSVLRFALDAAEQAWDLGERIEWDDLLDDLARSIDWTPEGGDWDGSEVRALQRWVRAQEGEA